MRSGSSIPVDGIVEEGVGVINQSSMTGEPIGVKREAGGAVFAGTVVEEGEIVIKVTSVGDDTRFRQVATFIEESEALKAGIQGKSERLADMAVPFTFGLAGIVYLLTRNFIRAASVLLVVIPAPLSSRPLWLFWPLCAKAHIMAWLSRADATLKR